MNKVLLYSILIIFISKTIIAQISPGQWRDYLPYWMAEKVVVGGNKIFCNTGYSLYYLDKSDESINTLSKVEGLSEVQISTIGYASKKDMLIIAYASSNIDILQKNKIFNLPYLKNKISIQDKKINDIMVFNDLAYLSCNFGIVVIDLNKLVIKDTYFPSVNGTPNRINHICTDGQNIYAATQTGIFKASLDDPFLVDYSRWELLKNFQNFNNECNSIEYLNGKLFGLYLNSNPWTYSDRLFVLPDSSHYGTIRIDIDGAFGFQSINVSNGKLFLTSFNGTTLNNIYQIDGNLKVTQIGATNYPTFATLDESGNIWVSDLKQSLVKFAIDGSQKNILPNGFSPYYPEFVKIDYRDGNLWTVTGGKAESSWYPQFSHHCAQAYFNSDKKWHNFNPDNIPELSIVMDMINVKIDPFDTGKVYMAAWTTGGLVEYNHGSFNFYNKFNSTLQPPIGLDTPLYKIFGLSFDQSGNLWVTNSVVNKQLSVLVAPSNKNPHGKWYSFSLGKIDINNTWIGDVLATSWGHKWVYITKSSTSNIVVFDDNGSIDKGSDVSKTTTISLSNIEELITSNIIYCMAEDRNQNIWIGTDAGPIVFSSPQDVFNGQGLTGSKIKVPVATGKNDAAFLLETERINVIAVDGANRKWLGTQNSGVYLMSDDGLKQFNHFTAENSPLLSNSINDITIDPKTGEVYFATSNGLISYRGMATEGGQDFGRVYVFPDPVRENYNGDIFITGLIEDANVKITDISGNLVFETTALGGQASWNGKNLLNKRVHSGVYLVFCANKDGSKTYVTKLLFIH